MIAAKKATLKDIALEAGVSKCLASRILNGKNEGVWASARTREKIVEAAKRLNYTPNISARRLVAGRKDAIGVFIDAEADLKSLFVTLAIRAIVARAEELGYSVNLGMAGGGDKLKLLERGVVDSAILMPTSAENCLALQERLAKDSIPYVSLNPGERLEFNAVGCDDAGGVELAVRHLHDLGHERIAFMGRPSRHGSYMLRREAFLRCCEGKGIDIQLREFFPGMMAEAMRSCDASAYLLYYDEMLSPFYIACHSLGLELPQDISVIGINDTEDFNKFLPKPTSVSIPVCEMGRSAVEMLDELLRTGKPVKSVEFKETLAVRESCACPRKEGALK